MIRYKVTFRDNKAIAANRIDYVNTWESVKMDKSGRSVNWVVLYGNDASDVISLANNIVGDYLLSFSK